MEVLTLGEKIKLKRKEKNLTLKELAGDRITPGQISLVESGKSNPSIELLEYLAERLETDIEYFLESEEKQASRICEFYSNICESAIISENFFRAEEFIEKGLFYAQKYNLNYYKAKFEYFYAKIMFKKNDLEGAQLHCLSANSLFLKLDNIDYIIKSFLLLGHISIMMGYVTTALNYFMQADAILNEHNHVDEVLKANVLYNIAMCYYKLGNSEQAIAFASLAKDKLAALEDKKQYGETLMLLSISYAKENNLNEALRYAKLAKKIFSMIEANKEISDIEMNLGMLFSQTGDVQQSFDHLERALRLKMENKDASVYEALFIYCDNYIKLKDYNKALDLVNRILNDAGDNERIRIKVYEYLYRIYEAKEDYKNIEISLLEAVKYLENLDYKKELADFYTLLGKFYMKSNEKELALNYINKGLETYKDLGIILT